MRPKGGKGVQSEARKAAARSKITALPEAPTPRREGRPTIATPETIATILRCVGKGLSMTSAAHRAGVSQGTVLVWRRTIPGFGEQLREARAKGEEALVDLATCSNNAISKGAQFVLERSYRGRWQRHETRKVLTHNLDGLTREQVLARIEAAKKILEDEMSKAT